MRVVSDAEPLQISAALLICLLEVPIGFLNKFVVKAQDGSIIKMGVIHVEPVKQTGHMAAGHQALTQFDTINEL